MVMASTRRLMGRATLESGSMTCRRVQEKRRGLIRVNLRGFIARVQNMDRANIRMPTVLFTKVTGKKMQSRVSEHTLG